MKHTPGPWKPFPSGVYAESRADGLCVCTRHKQATDEDWSANAPVLAAAPDMLDELKNLIRCFQRDDVASRHVGIEHPGVMVTINRKTLERIRGIVAKAVPS